MRFTIFEDISIQFTSYSLPNTTPKHQTFQYFIEDIRLNSEQSIFEHESLLRA